MPASIVNELYFPYRQMPPASAGLVAGVLFESATRIRSSAPGVRTAPFDFCPDGRNILRRSIVHSRFRIRRLWVDRPVNPAASKILDSANPLPPDPSIVRASMQIHSPSGLR